MSNAELQKSLDIIANTMKAYHDEHKKFREDFEEHTAQDKVHQLVAEKYQERFDEHVDVYRKNGKEAKALKEQVSLLREEMQPILVTFKGISWGQRAVVWFLGIAATVIGILIGIKQLIK